MSFFELLFGAAQNTEIIVHEVVTKGLCLCEIIVMSLKVD